MTLEEIDEVLDRVAAASPFSAVDLTSGVALESYSGSQFHDVKHTVRQLTINKLG